MACGNCGTGVGGCKSSGGCATGSCNRMNVHDWLSNLPYADPESSCKVVEVSFNNGSRKDFYRNSTGIFFTKGDMVAVEGVNGFDVGQINMTGELVRLQMKKNNVKEHSTDMRKVLRFASEFDINKLIDNKAREKNVLIRSRAIARQLKLEMKMAEVEIQADGKKATFFYIADDRVDFRELIKLYASEFSLKVEMRQIGARQEAGKVGGIGSCGRELCCSTWLSDFKSVNTQAARYQNLSINQSKLSGQCGRLKCCLNYELDTYMDALQAFPNDADTLFTTKGRAILIKKDIFKSLMWYMMPDSSKQYPMTIDMVRNVQKMNKEGNKPEELETAELSSSKPKEIEPAYADLVGQISLKSLEKTTRRRRDKERAAEQRQTGTKTLGQGKPGNAPLAKQAPKQGQPPRPPRPQNRGSNKGQAEGQAESQNPTQQTQGQKPQGQRPQGQRPQGPPRPRPQGQPNNMNRRGAQQEPRPPRNEGGSGSNNNSSSNNQQ